MTISTTSNKQRNYFVFKAAAVKSSVIEQSCYITRQAAIVVTGLREINIRLNTQ